MNTGQAGGERACDSGMHDGCRPAAPVSDIRVVALIALYFLLMVPNLNNSHPYQGDETFYTISALNMIDRGDYLSPVYAGEYRFNKPILTYWVAAAGYLVFGASMWGARVPILLLACLTVYTTFRLALYTLGDRRAAGLAAALLAASPMFFSFSRVAMTEMVLLTFTVPAVLLFAKALTDPGRAARWAALGSACVGMAFLAKGPVGLLPYVAALIHCAIGRRPEKKRVLLALLNPVNLLIVAAIAVPWYAYVVASHPAAFASDIGSESRSLGSNLIAGMPGRLLHAGSTLALFLFPFSLAGAVAIIRRRALWSPRCAYLVTCCAVHLLVFVLFVGVFKSRYLLPMIPVACVVLADVLFPSGWGSWVKVAAAAVLLQAAFYAAHPLVAHEPLRELTGRWKEDYVAAGTLGIALDAKRAGWCRLYANDRTVAALETADFLIVPDAILPEYAGWELVESASQHARVNISRDGLSVTDETFHLIRKPEYDTRGRR